MKTLISHLIVVFLISFTAYKAHSQVDTINVNGTVSSTTAASLNNIPVKITYLTLAMTTVHDTTVFTDTFGVYSHQEIINNTVRNIEVSIPKCTSTVSRIVKQEALPAWSGVISRTVNFVGFCFDVNFTSFDSSGFVHFTGQINGGVPPVEFGWDFGDGSWDSLSLSPSHFYATPGPFAATLTAVDSLNDTIRALESINLNDCIGLFFHTDLGNNEIQFYDSSTTPFSHANFWDFGDGQTSTLTNPVHTYGSAGNYNVCLTITDSTACSRRYCDTVEVDTAQCVAGFTLSKTKNIVSFTNTSFSTTSPSYFLYNWDFGDGSGFGTVASPVHVYQTTNSFVVRLSLVDTFSGCRDTVGAVVINNYPGLGNVVLAGTVSYESVPVVGTVTLIGDTNNQSKVEVLDQMTTVDGLYTFQIKYDGTYYVRASLLPTHPEFQNTVPKYYEDSYFWNSSTGIVMAGNNSFDNDINLLRSPPSAGSGTISGMVNYDSGIPDVPGDPVSGAEIMLFTMDAQTFVQQTKTDTLGEYELRNLPDGTYRVHVEIPGKSTGQTGVLLTSTIQHVQNINFTVYDDRILRIAEFHKNEQLKVFPNPVSQKLYLNRPYNNEAEVTIRISDLTGRKFLEKRISDVGQLIEIDVGELRHGMYVLYLESDQAAYTTTFIKKD